MSLLQLVFVLYCVLCSELTAAQQGPTAWTVSPFSPFSLPLAVRNPYLNTWLPQGNNPPKLGENWETYWSNVFIGWFIALVVDGQAYQLAGDATGVNALNGSVIQKSVSFSPTNTSFDIQAGPMDVILSFLSPIEPNDLLRQSLPFSYMYMTAESNDGNAHNVRMYSDISGEFLLGAPGTNVSWQFNDDGTNVILSEQFVQPVPFSESGDHSLDAVEYYYHKRVSGTTTAWQISADVVNRNAATNMNTSLNNTADPGQRLLSDQWPVLGIQIDWGQITSTPEPAVFTLGLIRDPVIQYMLPNGTVQMRSPYFRSSFANDTDALKFFMEDFERAQQAAEAFDAELLNAGSSISSRYADLLALTTRQVLSSIDITIARGSDGNWNFTDTLVFLKNFGAAGSDTPISSTWTQSVNTVDTLFAAFPAFLYLNPELAGYLLAPLLKYQDSPAYTLEYAAKNIGSTYPNATADSINEPHSYGLEETANMLIMILAYSQLSGNNTLINSHYGLLQKWGQYLNQTAVAPSGQQWADYLVMQNNLPTNNQTNLALKGIIGIAAMSKIATIAGNSDDASRFNSTASSFIQTWQENVLSSSQVDYFYSDGDNTGLMYNLYADVLLGLNFVPSDVYSILTTYYNNLISSKGGYGIPLMNEVPGLTSVSAMMLSAATVTNSATRNAMIGQVHSYASSNFNNTPFGGYYNPIQGSITNENINYSGHGINSPTIGGIFSLLVKGNESTGTSKTHGPSNSPAPVSSKSRAGATAGAIVGGIAGLALLGGCVFILLRRIRRQDAQRMDTDKSTSAIARVERGPSMYGTRRGANVEPFPYTTYKDLKNGVSSLLSKVLPSQPSKNGVLAEARMGNQDHALLHSSLGGARVRVEGRSRSSAQLLMAVPGSENPLIEDRQRESGPSLLLLATIVNRDRALRDEVEYLRGEVERIRHGRIETTSEAPPPSYIRVDN